MTSLATKMFNTARENVPRELPKYIVEEIEKRAILGKFNIILPNLEQVDIETLRREGFTVREIISTDNFFKSARLKQRVWEVSWSLF